MDTHESRDNSDNNKRLGSDFSTGSRKHQFKSSRKCDNDDYNHERLVTIRHQLYGPGGPYDQLVVNQTECEPQCTLQVKHKQGQDETLVEEEIEEETSFGQKPTKKPKLDSSEHLAESDLTGAMVNMKIHSNSFSRSH